MNQAGDAAYFPNGRAYWFREATGKTSAETINASGPEVSFRDLQTVSRVQIQFWYSAKLCVWTQHGVCGSKLFDCRF